MKRIYLIFFAILLFPCSVFAIKGACSWHSGVNCSIYDWDGSVICNDGWRDSSVNYADADECYYSVAFPSTCLPPVPPNFCRTEKDYQEVYGWCQEMGAFSGHSQSCLDALEACRKNTDDYQTELDTYQQCLIKELYPEPIIPVQTPLDVQNELLQNCQKNRGIYSIYDKDNKRCICADGYAPDNIYMGYNGLFQCISMQKFCEQNFGNYSEPKRLIYSSGSPISDLCQCLKGFERKDNQCIEKWKLQEQQNLKSFLQEVITAPTTTAPVIVPSPISTSTSTSTINLEKYKLKSEQSIPQPAVKKPEPEPINNSSISSKEIVKKINPVPQIPQKIATTTKTEMNALLVASLSFIIEKVVNFFSSIF